MFLWHPSLSLHPGRIKAPVAARLDDQAMRPNACHETQPLPEAFHSGSSQSEATTESYKQRLF
jgi:hypothetical protein